jgi:hypothetical protein
MSEKKIFIPEEFRAGLETPKTPNPDWETVQGNFMIERRKTGTERWDVWCMDNDIAVMNTRFWTMSEILGRDASKFDALRLVNTDTGKVLSSGMFGAAVKEMCAGILPPDV